MPKKNDKIAIQKQFQEGGRAVSHPVANYAQRLVDPEGQDADLSPNPVSSRGTAVKTIKVLDLKDYYSTTSGSGECSISFNASPIGTIAIETRTSDVLDGEGILFSMRSASDAPISKTNPKPVDTQFATHGDLNQLAVGIEGVGILKNSISCDSTTKNFDILVEHDGAYDLGFAIYDSGNAGTGFAGSTLLTEGHCGPSGTTISSMSYSATETYVYFQLGGPSVDWRITFLPSSGSTLAQGFAGTQSNFQTIDMDLLSDVPQLETFRVTAMGMLGTYQGSDFANGGRLACARVSRYWQPPEGGMLDALAKLPVDSHNGPIKEGFHMHWVPGRITDLEPRHRESVDNSHLYRYNCALSADDVSQSFRIQVVMHVEYFSTSPSYGAMRYGPNSQGLSLALEYINMHIPLATENDKHRARKMLEYVGSKGKQGIGYVLKHPEVISELAALVL